MAFNNMSVRCKGCRHRGLYMCLSSTECLDNSNYIEGRIGEHGSDKKNIFITNLKDRFIKDGYENFEYDEDKIMGVVARLHKKVDDIRIHIKISKIGLVEVSVYNNSTILLKNFRDKEITFENLNKEIKSLIKQLS